MLRSGWKFLTMAKSPPSRGAWIEIWDGLIQPAPPEAVAPLAGGVD